MTLRASTLNTKWPRVLLADVAEFLDHRRRPITAKDRRPGPYPYYGANGQQDSVHDFLFDEPLVLLAEDGGHFADPARGVAYKVSGKCWVNNHAHVLRPKSGVDAGFLAWHLAHYDLSEFVNGTTRAKLTKAAAERIPLIRPPLEEQRRIADILDRADALRAKRRAALALLDELTRSSAHSLVGALEELPVVPLLDLLREPLRNGLSPSTTGTVDGVVLTLSAITGDAFKPEASKACVFDRAPQPNQLVSPGVFLICRGNGSRDLVGRGVVPRAPLPKVAFPDTMIAASPAEERIDITWLEFVWRSSFIRRQIERAARTTNGTWKVNQTALERVRVPLPDRAAQTRFARARAAVDRAQDLGARSLAEMDALFASLQDRAFRGEL